MLDILWRNFYLLHWVCAFLNKIISVQFILRLKYEIWALNNGKSLRILMFFAILGNIIFEIYEKMKKIRVLKSTLIFSGINKVGNIYADSL